MLQKVQLSAWETCVAWTAWSGRNQLPRQVRWTRFYSKQTASTTPISTYTLVSNISSFPVLTTSFQWRTAHTVAFELQPHGTDPARRFLTSGRTCVFRNLQTLQDVRLTVRRRASLCFATQVITRARFQLAQRRSSLLLELQRSRTTDHRAQRPAFVGFVPVSFDNNRAQYVQLLIRNSRRLSVHVVFKRTIHMIVI